MYGRLLEKSFGEDLAKSIGNMSKVDWLFAAGLVYSALKIGNAALPLWSRFRERNIPSDADMKAINAEYDSASALYDMALGEVKSQAYGAAIATIDAALLELNLTAGRRKMVQSREVHKVLQAKLRYLRAEASYYQGDYHSAEAQLLKVVKLDSAHVMSRNLLAHLYIHHFQKPLMAKQYLENSLALNSSQIFARFYVAMLNGDDKKLDELAGEIISIYQQQFHNENPSVATQQMLLLQSSTPAFNIMIPFVLLRWLEKKIEYTNDQKDIVKILSVFTATLQAQTFANQQQLQVMLKEARIKAYAKIARLRKLSPEFNELDAQDRNTFGLCLQEDDKARYFFEYDAEHIDRRVTRLFPQGNRIAYLLDQDNRYTMSQLIVGWAKEGWLIADTNPHIQDLCEKLLLAKQSPLDAELQGQVYALAASDAVVTHFLKQYVDGKGWAPWFKVVKSSDSEATFALISLACKQQGVNMHVYAQDKADKSVIHEGEKFVSGERDLHVIYDPAGDKLRILDELTSPARLYRWIALQSCWDLLQKDPSNACALELAGQKGYAALPDHASEALASGKLTKVAANSMMSGLGFFIGAQKGACQDGKDAAEQVKSKLYEKMNPTMFTRKRVISAIGAAALAGLGAYFIRNK